MQSLSGNEDQTEATGVRSSTEQAAPGLCCHGE